MNEKLKQHLYKISTTVDQGEEGEDDATATLNLHFRVPTGHLLNDIAAIVTGFAARNGGTLAQDDNEYIVQLAADEINLWEAA
jgi:hypothetical protein